MCPARQRVWFMCALVAALLAPATGASPRPAPAAGVFAPALAAAALAPLPDEHAAFEDGARAPSRPAGLTLAATTACANACQDRFDDGWPVPHDRHGNHTFKLAGALAGWGAGFAASRATPRAELQSLAPVPWWRPASVGVAGAAALAAAPDTVRGLAGGRWTDCDDHQDALNGIDRALRTRLAGRSASSHDELSAKLRRRALLARLSDATLWAANALPLGVISGSRGRDDMRDVVVYLEVQVANAGLLTLSKRFFQRPRPYAHFCEPEVPASLVPTPERGAQWSFYSGHASASFAGAMTAARLAHLRGHRRSGTIKWTGLGLASTTALLRVAADKHYVTDVIVGAGVGLALGHLIPQWQAPARRDIELAARSSTATPGAEAALDRGAVLAQDLPTPESSLFALRLGARAATRAPQTAGTWLAGGLAHGGPALAVHVRF